MFHFFSLALVSSILLFVSGCGDVSNVKWLKPNGRIYSYMPKTDDELYKKAWYEGCETGMSTGFGKDFNKSFHFFKKDVRFAGHKFGDERDLYQGKAITKEQMGYYERIWYDAMKACRHYNLASYKHPAMDSMPKTPGEAALKMDDISLVYEFAAWQNGAAGEGNIAFW